MKAAADAKGFSEHGRLKPGVNAGQVTNWLKAEHGLGHGHAMAVYALLSGERKPHPDRSAPRGHAPEGPAGRRGTP